MRYSKQREAVYGVLYSTDTHPDVSWIYNEVKKIIPKISLATVYRNLDELESLGRIKKVSVEGYSERYDANVSNHAHLVCESCGKIADADMSGVTGSHSYVHEGDEPPEICPLCGVGAEEFSLEEE